MIFSYQTKQLRKIAKCYVNKTIEENLENKIYGLNVGLLIK